VIEAFCSCAFFSKTLVVSICLSPITIGLSFLIIPAFSKAIASKVSPKN
jgi:hypothetical protein